MAKIENTMPELPYKMLDFDQHSYEAQDCFTRYMPKDKIDTAVRPIVTPSGKKVLLANERIVTALEADLDLAYVPGSLAEMLKQRASGKAADAERFFEPMQKEYLDKNARLAQLTEQQIERSIMYPGGWALFAWVYLEGQALYDNLTAFNRWINDDWGYNTQDRIYAPAMLSMEDLDSAVAELDRVIADGARIITLPPGPAAGRSPGDPYFDPFWSRVNEAKLIVAFHITENHYQENVASHWGWGLTPPFQFSAWQWQNTYGERPITDTLSALIFDNLFGRYPNIQVLSSEYGASWVPHFLKHMDKSRGMGRNGPWLGGQLTERPSAIFNQHVNVVPYPEDDVPGLVAQVGVDSLLMGSDWPHAEGLREPAEFFERTTSLDDATQKAFLRDNGLAMLGAG